MSIGDALILVAAAIDIVVTSYLLVSYVQHRRITATDEE